MTGADRGLKFDWPTFSPSFYRNLFWCLAALGGVLMVVLSFDYGITWDERDRSYCARAILRFFLTGGADKECLFPQLDHWKFYGGFFDVLAAVLYGAIFRNLHHVAFLPASGEFTLPYYYEVRHALNACFGFTAMLFTALIAKELRNWRTAIIAFLLIFLTPRFFGGSMNNPKDIPFAMAYAMSLCGMVRLFKAWPRLEISTAVLLVVSIAIAINIKAAGLLLIIYLFLFSVLAWLLSAYREKKFQVPYKTFLGLAAVAVAAYFGGLLIWPYGLADPVHNPLKALAAFSYFAEKKDMVVLFEGNLAPAGMLPWYYVPKWIFITVPLFIHIGLVLLAVFLRQMRALAFLLFFLVFAAVFPVAYAILKHSVVYNGWRHFLFVYPPLVVLAAVAWDHLLACSRDRKIQLAVGVFLALYLVEPAIWMVRFHPHEYVYFNALVDGLRGAYGKYETDYWGNGVRLASEWICKRHKEEGQRKPVKVLSNCDPLCSTYYLMRGLGPDFRQCAPGDPDWDYWVGYKFDWRPNPADPQKDVWPPPSTVYTVDADGVPLCVVARNPNRRS